MTVVLLLFCVPLDFLLTPQATASSAQGPSDPFCTIIMSR